MSHSHAKYLVVVLFFLGGSALAQTGATSNPTNGRENNPYSKFGIGELWNSNNTVLRGMANTTSAYENPYEVNSDNPASYSFLQRTTFEAGAMGSTRTINGAGETYTSGTATIAYLNIGIPVTKNSGLCFGFKPYSKIYYNMADSASSSPIGQYARSYFGEGTINYAYLGYAAKYKGLSIGVNGGYMFGNLVATTAVLPIDTAATNRSYATEFANYNRIGGLYWKAGIMYETKIDSDYTLRIGGTFTMQQNLSEQLNSFQISTFNFGDTLVNDTAATNNGQRGKLRLPMSYSIGVMLAKNDKWGLAVDYTATKWSGFGSTPDSTLTSGIGSASYKISVGGEYTPNFNDIRKYSARITYRAGLYYGHDYLQINNTNIPYYGITAGASLPFRRSVSHLHTSIDVGRLGMTTNGLIQETYIRFTVGVSFNDRWFIPRKYD